MHSILPRRAACAPFALACLLLTLALVPSRIARADASGGGTFPGVPPGTYYLMASAIYNKQSLVWGQPVHVNTGQNSITLDLRNATPLN